MASIKIKISGSTQAGRYHWLTILVLLFLSLLLHNLYFARQSSVLDMRLVGPLHRGRALSLGVCSLVLAVARHKVRVSASGPKHIVIAQEYGTFGHLQQTLLFQETKGSLRPA